MGCSRASEIRSTPRWSAWSRLVLGRVSVYLNCIPCLRAISFNSSRVSCFGGALGALATSRKNPSSPGGADSRKPDPRQEAHCGNSSGICSIQRCYTGKKSRQRLARSSRIRRTSATTGSSFISRHSHQFLGRANPATPRLLPTNHANQMSEIRSRTSEISREFACFVGSLLTKRTRRWLWPRRSWNLYHPYRTCGLCLRRWRGQWRTQF